METVKTKGKVVFVNPSLRYGDEPQAALVYPFPGLMILASILDAVDYEVKVVDANIFTEAEFERRLFAELNDDVLYVGFNLMTMNVAWAYGYMLKIKAKFPLLRIIVGGFHPTLFPQQMINDENVDIVVVNEAVHTIELLTDTIRTGGDLSKVPGIMFKDGGQIIKNTPNTKGDSFENLPFINFELFEHELYATNNAVIYPYFPKPRTEYRAYPIQTSFGCPYRCTFCINAIFSRRYKIRSAEEIVARIEYLMERYNANFFILYDEEFCIDKKRLYKFVELVEEKKLKFQWRTSLRVSNFRENYLNDEWVKRLENIGFVCSVMGGESGSQRILDEIKKQITLQEMVNAFEALSKTTIVPKISFMAGLPGESDAEVLASYRFAIKLKQMMLKKNLKTDIGMFPFRLYPGSPLYDKAVKELGVKEETRTLKEFAAVNGKEMAEGMGYEAVYNKYLKDPVRFEKMLFLYDTFIWPHWGNGTLFRNILSWTTMKRFEYGFFNFTFIERFILKSAKTLRSWLRAIRLLKNPYVDRAKLAQKVKGNPSALNLRRDLMGVAAESTMQNTEA